MPFRPSAWFLSAALIVLPTLLASCGPSDRPLCCGCLCEDPTWSCSENVCLDGEGRALELTPEAGFLELEPRELLLQRVRVRTARHRVWYSFQPARVEAGPDAPLLVFFNGGPGKPTLFLLGGNTGEVSLDTPMDVDWSENASPWTRLGHLLYIDAPFTGFSHWMRSEDDFWPSDDSPRIDAANFLLVILRFLARHPQLEAEDVVLVGESYGGVRATWMRHHLIHRTALLDETPYQDLALADAIAAHAERALGGSEADLESQFETLVMIQPALTGYLSLADSDSDSSPLCLPEHDEFDCSLPPGASDATAESFAARLNDVEIFEALIGVDPLGIAWLHSEHRVGAGSVNGDCESAFEAVFGSLEAGDCHYVRAYGSSGGRLYSAVEGENHWTDPSFANVFLDIARRSDVLITDTGLDAVVDTGPLADQLAGGTGLSSATRFPDRPLGSARPGEIQLLFDDGEEKTLRIPTYDEAAHVVTLSHAAELLADVMEWYAALD